MSNKTYQTTLLIRGDSKNAVREVSLTRDQLDKLTTTQNKGIAAAARYREAFNTGAKQVAKWGSVAAAAATGVAAAMVRSGLQSVDSLAKVSNRLGVATEDLASLRFAAEQTGVSTSTLDMALQRMTRRVAEAAAGSGEAKDALKELGLSAKELNDLSPDQTFRRVTEAMEGVGNQSDRVRLAMKLFDSEGVSLVQTMAAGADGLDTFAQQARDAGLAISQVDASRVEAANDAMNRIRSTFSGLSQQLAIKAAPALEAIANRLAEIIKEGGGVASVVDRIIRTVLFGADAIVAGFNTIKAAGLGLVNVANLIARQNVWAFSKIEEAANKLWNALPWVDKRRSSTIGADLLATIDRNIEETTRKIQATLMTELPSDAYERFRDQVADSMQDAGESAQEFVATSEFAFDSMRERLLKARESLAKSHTELTKLAKKEADKSATDLTAAYERGLERLDDSFAGFFNNILQNGKISFDGLKDLFTRTLSEMIVAAVRNPIMVSLGFGGTSTAASAAGAASGAGGIMGIGSSLLGGIGSFGAGAMNLLGQGSSALATLGVPGMGSLSTGAFQQGMTMTGGTALAGAGAGLLGGFASNAVFGSTSGIGNTAGGLIGMALGGPLGAGIGSFLGGGVESLFGGDNNGENAGRAQINLGTGRSTIGGVGRTFDEGNVSHVQGLADFASQVASIIGGSSANLDITAGRSGISVGGSNFGNDSAAAIQRVFQNVVNNGDELSESMKRVITGFQGTSEQMLQFADSMISIDRLVSRNPIDDLFQQIEQGSQSASSIYRDQLSTIDTLRRNFDGSASAAQELNAALANNQQTAVQLAMAFQQVGDQARITGDNAARSIRESVMSEQELRQTRLQERNQLFNSLGQASGPDELARNLDRVQQLNTQLFQAIQNPDGDQAERFAQFAERTAERGEELARRQQEELRQTQQRQNDQINATLQSFAAEQQRAVQEFSSAVSRFSSLMSNFRAMNEANA